MHYSDSDCSDRDTENEFEEPVEKKPKIENGGRREHAISRGTRIMDATLFSNPPRIGHLVLDQTDVDDIVGGEIAWNEFRQKYLQKEDGLLYVRHYRYVYV